MRFVNLLTLLAATSAFALNLKGEEQLEQLGQVLGAAQSEKASNKEAEAAQAFACLGILTSFLDKCYGIPMNDKTQENLNAATSNIDCKLINTNECQAALKDISTGKCGGEKLTKVTPIMNMLCATDEKGNACPFSETFQKYMKDSEAIGSDRDALTNKVLEDTCKSKKCTETAINVFSEMKKNGMASDEKEMEKYINYLSEDNCKNAAVTIDGNANTANAAGTDNTADGSSGATKIKIGSILLATLALALYFFFK